MRSLLERNGWRLCQRVVQLNWTRRVKPVSNIIADDVVLRKMRLPDVAEVARIDHDCFEAIWRHSEDAILRAYQQETYSTVAEQGGRIVGYQITTQQRNRAHIARLAVRPDCQRAGIGQALVMDTIERFRKPWTREISVNTQEDNEKSLRLYQKLGFELSDESFPIYIYPK
jgi:ribosomal protein S18 acetylase RimI-like enzyme